ncbi:hypothetical protein A5645_13760 [Mycobacterium asiaticum]|uniref:hypothetical protein n=1 Tax=Mycobacterium asiaticum TaxID=1790 RepID=UPI0007EFE3BF|nr:hypothetical protein [Mycobacterium asiaticum]OBK95094.1 hypothetical protein A5645_13760 [Mycobacterium asiaticum]
MSLLKTSAELLCVAAVLVPAAGHPPTASADPSKLMGMLPEGFSSSNCQVKPAKAPAVEKVTCDESTVSGGPSEAAFGLFGNPDDMQASFKQVGGDKMTIQSSCPGNQVSPGPWTYGSSGKTGGQVECATMTLNSVTHPIVVWSDESKLRVAMIVGADMDGLYQWWRTKSG